MLEKPAAVFVFGDWKKNGRNNGLTRKKRQTIFIMETKDKGLMFIAFNRLSTEGKTFSIS